MVTLDDLRTAFLEQRQQQLKDLERTHKECLREMLFMSETYDKADVAGSPWKLGQSLEVAENDSREHVKSFLTQYQLSVDNQKSIKDHVLEQPKALRGMVSRDLKTGPVEVAPPPTPTSATAPSVADAQRDRERLKELEQSNKADAHRSQAVARAAAAVQARAIAEGVGKIKPLTITAAESQGVRVAPLLPGQVPSFVIESTTAVPPIAPGTDAVTPATSTAADPTTDGSTPAVKVESPVKTVTSPSKGSNALEKAVSPVPGLARNATAQSAGLRVPPSPTVVPTIPDSIAAPPLHPTLQVLSPNPLSVTYAASLRPLPPDPTRRITGAGVSGGAIHHRSGRKISSLANHSNVNSYSSIAAAKIGPAGSGQADLYRWYVRARASPGAGMVGKADKCLMTSDWKVAFNEQRFVRAMARIEKLKAQGEWSFRQPKKQKGPVVRKAHWDHLLEEMKWLQTDFREERRWKMTVAFHLAHEVAAWHRARTPAERAAFCVSVQRPYRRRTVSDNVEQQTATQESIDAALPASTPVEQAADVGDDEEMPDIAQASQSQTEELSSSPKKNNVDGKAKEAEVADVTMDEEDDEVNAAVTKAVDDAVETTNEAATARAEEVDAEGESDDADADVDDVEAATAALVSGEPSKPPQVEVVREPLPQSEPMPALSADTQPAPTSAAPADSNADATAKEAETTNKKLANALRSEPKNPESTLTAELPQQLLATLRAPIFSTNVTTTVVSPATLLESLDPEAAAALLGIEVGDLSNAADLLEPGSLSFSKMFPELPLYGGVSLPDPNSKSDRRWDEGSLNQPPRLTHVTKLLDSRPLLVSTLEPSKNRANGRWLPDSDWVVAAEQSDPLRGVADGPEAGLPPLPGSLLFARKSNRAAKDTNHPASTTPAEPAQPDARAAMFVWTPDEDNYLMTLAKQYHNNWSLVADLFNSTRLNTATDKREPWDCYDRCKRIQQAADEGKPPPGPPVLPAAAAESDKDKKTDGKDGADGSSKKDKLSKKLGSKYDGSKRKLRRSNLMEVMRKSAKRREASKQAQQTQQTKKVNLNTHETHAQIKAGPAITPQSLSALKAERDQAALRQYYEQQRAQLAYQQQQQQQQRLLAQQAQAQRMAQQQAAAGGAAGQAATSTPQPGKAVAAGTAAANVPAPLSLPPGSTPATQVAQQAAQKAAVPNQQPAAAQQQQQPPSQQGQAQAQQSAQPQNQQQLQAQFQASQAAQMQNLYAQIQQQQRQAQQQQQQNASLAAGQVRPAVGPLNPQQLASLTPQQQQQYHAQLAAATAAAQQQQLRNQMAAVAAAQGGTGVQGLPFQMPNAQQFQLMQQQQQGQQRPPNMQSQAQVQAAALQMYQQQQRQAAQVQAQAQMRPPQTPQAQQQQQQQQFGAVRPAGNTQRPPQNATAQQQRPGNANGGNTPAAGMPATIQALQQQLAISLATSNLSPEQINGLAIQLYKQAQQQQGAASPMAAGAGGQGRPQGAQGGGRPPQQILNQAIQALAAQNQKNGAQATGSAGGGVASGGVGSPVQGRAQTPRPPAS